jgi:hypothetical protein
MLRPSAATYKTYVKRILPLAIAMTVVLFVIHSDELLLTAILFVGIGGLGAGFIALYFRNAQVSSDGITLRKRNLFGVTREYEVDELALCIDAPLFTQQGAYGSSSTLGRFIILNKAGKKVLEWSYSTWSPKQIKKLTSSLGIPINAIRGTTSIGELRKTYPRIYPWWMAHIWATAGIIVGAILIGFGIWIAIWIAGYNAYENR